MKFHLKMDLSNDAFQLEFASPRQASANAVAEQLEAIAEQLRDRHEALTRFQTGSILDINGNIVGRWTVDE